MSPLNPFAEPDDLSPPTSRGTPWLRLSPHLRTRRPNAHTLILSISHRPPLNAINADVLSELKRVLLALDPGATRAVVLTVDPSGADEDSTPVLGLGPLEAGLSSADWPVGLGLGLRAESILASLGFRGLLRRLPPTAGLSTRNLLSDVCSLLRSITQLTIAAMRGESRAEGCELVLACDLRVFERAAGTTLVPGERASRGTVLAMRRLLGRARALEVLLLPQEEDVDDAHASSDKDKDGGKAQAQAQARGVVITADGALQLGLATHLVEASAAPATGGQNGQGKSKVQGEDDPLLGAACDLAKRALGGGSGRVAGIKALLMEEGGGV